MEPKVSVCLRTYNQVDFVSDAIESVLNQTTSFGFELVVGDDGSSDGTLDRIARYRRQYPAIIRLLPSETRLGGRRNLVRSIAACRGDYIAMLDGDDFWTSDQKLQLQSDLLDAFPEISACGHQHRNVDESQNRSRVTLPQAERAGLRDLLAPGTLYGHARFHMGHLTVMARRDAIPPFPDWFYQVPLGDKAFQLLCGLSGDFGYINNVMAVYRKHDQADWSARSHVEKLEGHVTLLENSRDVTKEFASEVNERLARLCTWISIITEESDPAKSTEYRSRAHLYSKSPMKLRALRTAIRMGDHLGRLRSLRDKRLRPNPAL